MNEYLRLIFNQNNNIENIGLCHNNEMEILFNEILSFSKWVYNSVNSNTAIIFLLRDTLLPYYAFQYWNQDNTVTALPLMIGRKFLFQFGDGDEIYNRISDAVYKSLHDNKITSHLFQNDAIKNIEKSLQAFPKLAFSIENLLHNIRQNKIYVNESGVHGTMPLLLKTYDQRISKIMLYTTLPWFYNAWDNLFFTKKYEELRVFETLLCQDLLFNFSSINNNTFYINEIMNSKIKEKAFEELKYWKYLIKK